MKHPRLVIAMLALATTSPAFALGVTRSVTVAAAPAQVWRTIGDFCGIGRWHPAIAKCVPGIAHGKPLRTLSLKGGGTLVEAQLARDDAHRSYRYAIVDGPLPVADYSSTIMVTPAGTGSKISWSGTFKAKGAPDAKAIEVVTGIYDAGLASLKSGAR